MTFRVWIPRSKLIIQAKSDVKYYFFDNYGLNINAIFLGIDYVIARCVLLIIIIIALRAPYIDLAF